MSKMAWAPRSSPSSPRLCLVAGLHRAGHAGCDFAAGRVAPVAGLADGAGGVVHDEQGDEHEAEAGAESGDRLDVLAADEAVPHAPEGGDAEREREVAGVQAEDAVHGQQAALDLVDVRVDEVEVERPVEGEQDALDGVEEAEPEEARDRLQRGEQVVGEVGDPRVDLDVVRVVADRVAVGGRSGGAAVGRALSRGALAAGRRSSAQVAERVAGGGGRGLLIAGAGSGGRVGAGRRRWRRSVAGLRVGRRLRARPGRRVGCQRGCCCAARDVTSRAAAIPESWRFRSSAGTRTCRRNWRCSQRSRGRTGRRRAPLAPARSRSAGRAR